MAGHPLTHYEITQIATQAGAQAGSQAGTRAASDELNRRDWNQVILDLMLSDSHRRQMQQIAAESGQAAARSYVNNSEFKATVRDMVTSKFNQHVVGSPTFAVAVARSVDEIKRQGDVVVDRSVSRMQAESTRICDALVDEKYAPMFVALEKRALDRAELTARTKVHSLTQDAQDAVKELREIQMAEQHARKKLESSTDSIDKIGNEVTLLKAQLDNVQTKQQRSWLVVGLGVVGGLLFHHRSSL